MNCTGLVVRVRPLTETSLIVQWVTRELGRISTVAKGARRANSPFRGKLDVFYLAELSLKLSRRSDLHTLNEVKLLKAPSALREDWSRLQQAAYVAALIEAATESDSPIPDLFDLLVAFVENLELQPANALRLLAFEAKLLVALGLDPAHRPAALSACDREMLGALINLDWQNPGEINLDPAQAESLARFLYTCLADGLQRVPKNRGSIFRAVLP